MSWNEHQPVKLDWMKEYYETERIYKQNRTRVYILFGIGMLLNLGLWIWYAKAEGYHPVLEQLQIISPTWKNQFFLYLDDWKRSDIGMRMFGSVILLGMVVGRIYRILCQIGFLFGIWWVWKRFWQKSMLICMLSILFCFITIWFYLGAAYVIAGPVMLCEFMKLHTQKVKREVHKKAIDVCKDSK